MGLETPSFRKLHSSTEFFTNPSAFPGAAVTPCDPNGAVSLLVLMNRDALPPGARVPGDSGPAIICSDSVPAPVPWPVTDHPSPCHRRCGDFTAGSFNHWGSAAPSSLPCHGSEAAARVPPLLEGLGM